MAYSLKDITSGIKTNELALDYSSEQLTDLAARHYIVKFRIAKIKGDLLKMRNKYSDQDYMFMSLSKRRLLARLENLEKALRDDIFTTLNSTYPSEGYK